MAGTVQKAQLTLQYLWAGQFPMNCYSNLTTRGSMYTSLRLMCLATILTLLPLSVQAQANDFVLKPSANCTTVRLDKDGAFAQLPHYDMGGRPICVPYTISTLFNEMAFNESGKNAKFMSPLYYNVKYANSQNQTNLRVDTVFSAHAAAKFEVCPTSVFGDSTDSQRDSEFLNALLVAYKAKNQATLSTALEVRFDKIYINNLRSLGEYFKAANYVIFVDSLFTDLCKTQSFVANWPEIEFTSAWKFGPSQRGRAMDEIRKVIDKNLADRRGTGMSYCELVLKNPSIEGVDAKGVWSDQCKVGDGFNGHAGIVVGRRLLKFQEDNKSKSVCQYLVRDVYGKSCKGYTDDPTVSPPQRCEQGNIWVDEDALLANIRDTYTLRR